MHTRVNHKFMYALIFFLIIFIHASTLFADTASLSWSPPAENADGTNLSDLAGYTISYGTESGNYNQSIDVGNVTTYEVQELVSGMTYYFSVTAYDLNGNESEYSNEGSKYIQDTTPVTYYCDSDSDGSINSSADGVCTGIGCKPAGCVTTPGNDCNDNNSAISPGESDSNCNGIDENCDGTPDNNYVVSTTTCGTGACQSSGQLICSNGSVEDTCASSAPTGDDSDCNGIDDNCDGTPDNNYVVSTTTCGTGVCSSTGQLECQNGVEGNTCIEGPPAENIEFTCSDSLDNDCDGKIDDSDSNCLGESAYTILKTVAAPIVDGDLTEYTNAHSIAMSAASGGNIIEFKALWDDTALYLAYSVADHQLNASAITRDDDPWSDDSVGWFIDTLSNRGDSDSPGSPFMLDDDYRGLINIINTLNDAQGTISGSPSQLWDGNWLSAVQLEGTPNSNSDNDHGYTVEVKIPWTSLGYSAAPADKTIGMSFINYDRDASLNTNTMWTDNLSGSFENASNWQLVLVSIDTLITYYCDSDKDGYISTSAADSCIGLSCVPAECEIIPGTDCNDSDGDIYPGAAEVCDGKPNDCNFPEGVDGRGEQWYGSSTSCGNGICASTGEWTCTSGIKVDTCTEGIPSGDDSNCNGIDENCDGTPDNNYATSSTNCGTGACQSSGQLTCSNGAVTDTCISDSPSGDDSDCNNIDDDCDGIADNHYVISISSCGTGVCSSLGQVSCNDGSEIDSCTDGIPDEQVETTTGDGLDNDCDGLVDEGKSAEVDISRVIMAEDFSEGIPEFWTTDGSWDTENSCGQVVDQPFAGPFAIADSSCTETGINNLATSPFDTSGCDTATLSFSNQYYWNSGSVEVDISTDGGTTWANHIYIESDDGYPTPAWKEIDLGTVTESDKTLLNFKYSNDSTDGFWAIDNIWVTCKSADLDFSSDVNMQSSPESILISNTGSDSLSIDTITITGADASDFDIDPADCLDNSLLPGESCMIDIVFTAGSDGVKNATIIITTNAPSNQTSSILLTGTGISAVPPVPGIRVNGLEGPANIKKGDPVTLTVELDPNSYISEDADWWILMKYKNRWYSYSYQSGKWRRGNRLYQQGPIVSMGPVEVLNTSSLRRGVYTFHFGVDTKMNGLRDFSNYYVDSITVNIE